MGSTLMNILMLSPRSGSGLLGVVSSHETMLHPSTLLLLCLHSYSFCTELIASLSLGTLFGRPVLCCQDLVVTRLMSRIVSCPVLWFEYRYAYVLKAWSVSSVIGRLLTPGCLGGRACKRPFAHWRLAFQEDCGTQFLSLSPCFLACDKCFALSFAH